MNTIGSGTGSITSNSSGYMLEPKIIETLHNSNSDIDIESFELTNTIIRKTSIKPNMPEGVHRPICLWNNKFIGLFEQTRYSPAFSNDICLYDSVFDENTNTSHINITVVPSTYPHVFTCVPLGDKLLLIGTSDNLYDTNSYRDNNKIALCIYDGKSITVVCDNLVNKLIKKFGHDVVTNSSDKSDELVFNIRVISTADGSVSDSFIIHTSIRSHKVSGDDTYMSICKLTDTGFEIVETGYVSMEDNSSTTIYQPEKCSIPEYKSAAIFTKKDNYYRCGSIYLEIWSNSVSYEFTYGFKEYKIALTDDGNPVSYNNPHYVYTETRKQQLIRANTNHELRFCIATNLTPLSRTKWLFCLLNSRASDSSWYVSSSDIQYIAKSYLLQYTANDDTYICTDVSSKILPSGKWEQRKLSLQFDQDNINTVFFNLFNETPYAFQWFPAEDYGSGEGTIHAQKIALVSTSKYQGSVYTVSVYLLKDDEVSCNAGIIEYKFNTTTSTLNNVTKFKIPQNGYYEFHTRTYDDGNKPDFIIKNKKGMACHFGIEEKGNDISGYFQKGMKINGVLITKNGYQLIPNVFVDKRIDIEL